MLEIKNLHVSVNGIEILKGINLSVKAGEVHAIMGPNGSGKSTLSRVLAGHPAYTPTQGSATYLGKDLFEMNVEERSRAGVFLAFQYPVDVPGVSNSYFLRTAVNELRLSRGEKELDAAEFLKQAREEMKLVEMDASFLSRPVNEGFSGGEKKRNEIFQMAMLKPKLGLLDETDSGLDIDALKVISEGVNRLRSKERAFVLVTHYQRLLSYIQPDFVHVLMDGKIVKSGDKSLALELEAKGYDWIRELAVKAGE